MPGDGSEDQVFCPSCGEPLPRAEKYCRNCGEANRVHPDVENPSANHEDPTGTVAADEPAATSDEWGGPPVDDDWQPADETPDPWETEKIRRVEQGVLETETEPDADPTTEPGRGPEPGGETPQWRRFLPGGPRRSDESLPKVVATVAGIVILAIISLIVVTFLMASIGTGLGLDATAVLIFGTIVGQYVGFAGLGIYYLRRRGFDWDQVWGYLGVRKPTLKEMAIAILSWFIILGLIIALSFAIEFLFDALGAGEPDEPEQGLDEVITASPALLGGVILMMFLVVGPCEELLFRGIVQGRLRERLSALPAILIASGLFASVHVIAFIGSAQAILLGITVLFVTSLVLGWVYEYTESLVAAATLHAFHNSMVSIIIYVQVTQGVEEGMLALPALIPF